MNIRPIELTQDHATLVRWWEGHRALAVPREILPRGWVVEADGVGIAASFLYMDAGKIGVIEWTTTNPAWPSLKDRLAAVKQLYAHLEAFARDNGCLAVISFVKPNGSEERIMGKMGYAASSDDPGHRLYAKPLHGAENFATAKEGALSCP